ncbi:MAG: phosphatidate cytidylyltransferase, partial [Bacilli bacterium]
MKNRIIIGLLIFIPFVLIVYFSALAFRVLAGLAIILATKEILSIKPSHYASFTKIIVYLLNISIFILFPNIEKLNLISVALLLLIYLLLMVFDQKMNFEDTSFLFTLNLYVLIGALCAVFIRNLNDGFYIMMYVVLVTAASDSGAYFVGTFFGKHKLIPRISPKKSIEGAIGGLLIATIIGTIYSLYLPVGLKTLPIVVIVTLVLAGFGQLGDLIFSSVKRTYGIKD